MLWTLLPLLAYLLGAIPFGLLIARARGVDIRKVGSGNIGATNVFRSVGKGWGLLTFALDALKGFVPAWLFPAAASHCWGLPRCPELQLVCGVAAIVGHNWPVYAGFRGGKGVATSAGAVLGIAPVGVLIGLASWAVFFALSRYVSLASILAAVTLAAAAWPLYRETGWVAPATLSALAALIVWRHRANIRRLRDGTEHRFGRPKERTGEETRR
jgi:glycerol-3-phosphate acyltransferase PlsY